MILCRTQQQVKNFNNLNFTLLNGRGHKPGILTNLIHLSCIYLAALTTESSELVKLREELLWCQLGWAMCLPRLEIMTGQSGKKCNVCQRKGELVQMRVPRSGPAQLTLCPRVIFKPGSTWGPAQLGLIHWLTHNTCWMNRPVDPPSQANLAGSIHLVGLADPLYQSLKK